MRLDARTKKILKIATVSVLAVLEIYLIYAAAASMTTYHQHPRFVSSDGQVAQSSGYRTQFFLCLAFAIAIPIAAGVLSYFFWWRKPKLVTAADGSAILPTAETAVELAATIDDPASNRIDIYDRDVEDDPAPLPR